MTIACVSTRFVIQSQYYISNDNDNGDGSGEDDHDDAI